MSESDGLIISKIELVFDEAFMDLCHLIWLRENFEQHHSVVSLNTIKNLSKDKLMFEPERLSFFPYWICVAVEKPVDGHWASSLKLDLSQQMFLTIADDVNMDPFLNRYSTRRRIFILGEIIEGIFESLQVLGFSGDRIYSNPSDSQLRIDFRALEGSPLFRLLGQALCFSTALDHLLFARGLTISSLDLSVVDVNNLWQGDHLAQYVKAFK